MTQDPIRQQLSENGMRPPSTTWAILCHLGSFTGFFFPFGSLLTPFLIWIFKRHESGLIDESGKACINFQLSSLLYLLIGTIGFVVLLFTGPFLFFGFVFIPLLILFWLILPIIGAIKASNGDIYRYPFTIRFLH